MIRLYVKIITMIGMFIALSPLCIASTWCPRNDDVTLKIEELAHNGKALLNKKIYHLIGRDKTSIFFTGKFLQNSSQLSGFLGVSKLFDKKLPAPDARLVRLLPTPNFCAYRISLGKNDQFIALSTTP